MNKHTKEQITRFMSILKSCGLTKDEIFSITALMKTEDMMLEIAEQLKSRNFKTTPQETMNICVQVIKKY